MGEVATDPLPSLRSPTLRPGQNARCKGWLTSPHVGKKARQPLPLGGGGYPTFKAERKREEATQQLSQEPKCEGRSSITDAFSGLHNTLCGDNIRKCYRTSISRPKCGQSGYITLAFLGVPNMRHRKKSESAT